MKILDYVINEYFSLKEIQEKEDLCNLPIFENVPENFLGFYIHKTITQIKNSSGKWENNTIFQLKHRCID